jgi:ComF family protein
VAGPIIASESESSRVRKLTLQAAEGLFAVLFPSDCRICGNPLVKISRLPVCQECLRTMQPMNGSRCAICGERVLSPYAVTTNDEESGIRCGVCQRIEQPFGRALAYGSYDGALRDLIHLLKYESVRPAANVLGRMLAEVIAELEPGFGPDSILVIPVPLYRSKLRRREFNHAELIVQAALKFHRVAGRLGLKPNLLVRKRDTVSQTGLTRHQRRENVRGAFAVTDVAAVKAREVLVVDDVFTTGATVSECARVLHRAGASKVWVATVARTLKVVEQHVEVRLPEAESANSESEVLARAVGL